MRELTVSELQQVGGHGITRGEAGAVLATYGGSILAGAVLGGLTAGPAGILMGALSGASRVAVGGGITIFVTSLYKLH